MRIGSEPTEEKTNAQLTILQIRCDEYKASGMNVYDDNNNNNDVLLNLQISIIFYIFVSFYEVALIYARVFANYKTK